MTADMRRGDNASPRRYCGRTLPPIARILDTACRTVKRAWVSFATACDYAVQPAARRPRTERILVNLSGRGDKDVDYVIANHGAAGGEAQ
jgi:hypothetical protein